VCPILFYPSAGGDMLVGVESVLETGNRNPQSC